MSFESAVASRRKTGGRVKGTPNKRTALARDQIGEVFDLVGGTAAFAEWVKRDDETRRIFYVQIWPKILPLQGAAAADPVQEDDGGAERGVEFFRPTYNPKSGHPAEGADI